MPLTPKQRCFVEEYLIDLNAAAAARRAGYTSSSASTIGIRNLRHPAIADAIRAAQDARSMRTGITADRVLTELARMAFADIRRAVAWGTTDSADAGDQASGRGPAKSRMPVVLLASDAIDDDTAAAIAEVKQTRDGVSIKLHDKRAALVDLGRHLGLFKDRPERKVTSSKAEDLSDDELAALAAGCGPGDPAP